MLAYEMATREGQKGFSPVKQKAGRYWLKGFYQWFPDLCKKIAVNLLIAHAIGANLTQLSKFFDQYEEWLNQWGLKYSPNWIWNIDEWGVGDVPQTTTVVGVTGERTFQTVSREKSTNTMIVSYVSAGGLSIPPLVIFKASKIKPEWREVALTSYMIRGSPSGYINSKLFQECGKQFVHFLTEKKILIRDLKVLLLLDMHKSHLFNLDFMEFMRAHNVEVCCFPPHCTHVLQPLDNVPFALFKSEYQRQLLRIN